MSSLVLFFPGRGNSKWSLACYFLPCQPHLEISLKEWDRDRAKKILMSYTCSCICLLSLVSDFLNSDETESEKVFKSINNSNSQHL